MDEKITVSKEQWLLYRMALQILVKQAGGHVRVNVDDLDTNENLYYKRGESADPDEVLVDLMVAPIGRKNPLDG